MGNWTSSEDGCRDFRLRRFRSVFEGKVASGTESQGNWFFISMGGEPVQLTYLWVKWHSLCRLWSLGGWLRRRSRDGWFGSLYRGGISADRCRRRCERW